MDNEFYATMLTGLYRFSSDLYTIDDSLPFILNILLANFVGLLGIAVVLSIVQVRINLIAVELIQNIIFANCICKL